MTDAPQGEAPGWPAAGGSSPSTGGAGATGAPTGPPTWPPTAAPGSAPGGGSGGSKTVFVALAALLVGLLLGGAIGWAVSGSDDDLAAGSSDAVSAEWQAYCDRAEELVAEDQVLGEDEEAEVVAELVGLAPERYRSRLDALTRLSEMDDEPEDIGAAFDLFGDVFGQMMWFVGSLEVECGIDLEDEAFGSFDSDMGGSGEFDFDLDTEFGEGSTGTTSDSDRSERGSPFGEDDDGPMSLAAIQAHVADEPWVEDINSWGVVNEADVQLQSFDGDLSADDALAACEVITAYVAEHNPEGSVTVTADGAEFASDPAGSPCTAGEGADADA